MIFEPQIEVVCDGYECGESVYIEPPYVYHSYSGESGRYDCSDKTVDSLLGAEGWGVRDGKHYCEDCFKEESP